MKTVACFLTVLILSLPAWTAAPGADLNHVKRVAVLPLIVHDVENGRTVGQALDRILSTPLAADVHIRLLSAEAQSALKDREGATLSQDQIYMIGRLLGADYVVYGTVNQVGNNLGIAIELIDIPSYRRGMTLTAVCHGLAEAEPKLREYARTIEDAIDRDVLHR